jgi:hypothetical protein
LVRENAKDGVAQSETISSILRIPLAGLSYLMRQFDCPYRIFCDPREMKEDKAVLSAIDNFFSGPMNVLAPEESKLYGGMNNCIDSVDEIGCPSPKFHPDRTRCVFLKIATRPSGPKTPRTRIALTVKRKSRQ